MQLSVSLGAVLPRLLKSYGVEIVFGIPGIHTVELYRGLTDSGIRHITPRHEQGAGFMADGYARASGKPGVCFIISGPGMTNIVTAMGQAYGDSVPMLVISTVNEHGRMGSGDGWLHELPNQSGLVDGVAAFSRTLHTTGELAPALAQAFAVFDSARPRPVHIEIPIDVLLAEVADAEPAAPMRLARPAPNPAALDRAADLLAGARAPVILAGGGARDARIGELAERLDAPVIMTTNGRGLVPSGHPLGVSLSATYPATRSLIADADVVLAVGTELGPTDYDMFEDGGFALPGTLIRIDLDPLQITRWIAPALGLVGDAALAVDGLLERLGPTGRTDGADRAARANAGAAELPEMARRDLSILAAVRETLPDARIAGDSTQLVYSGNAAFAMDRPASYFNSATGYGTLGYGLPSAIGAKLADDRPVIALSGDGGLQFCLGELASAVEAGAPVILLLHDNDGYGEIKSYMQARNIRPIGVDIVTPDLATIAAASGWQVVKPSVETFTDDLLESSRRDGPTMLIFTDAFREGWPA
ncbi:5-guanidino-2-oxopentanoate decarboxylase [Amorphus orientalis]|uniref:Acetolactate synthase-1/2/3 large subunit n=1 Tax=Amorphus orientalis TaxID=649198 RepID=A0AAE3VLU9_9HYPH|nr:5-guanidino-2-oxopentanoate decarboxylase [Amorphus orientalis]MDQ0314125.1 acetolactate synthase-1/2/3 large subunit [Amorphus orientalis]